MSSSSASVATYTNGTGVTVTAPKPSATGYGVIGPDGTPNQVITPGWGGPVAPGQIVCAAGVYSATNRCCAALNGALWVPTNDPSYSRPQPMCLFFTNTTTANATRESFVTCVFNAGSEGNRSIAMCVDGSKNGSKSAAPRSAASRRRTALGLLGLVVQGPKWKDPLLDWQTVCATNMYNITDLCCAQQDGSVWADNSTILVGAGQHSCMINTTTEDTAKAARDAFINCVGKTPGGGSVIMCGSNDPKNKSGGRRTATMGIAALVWVAAGCVLVL
ncbi:uncharacterized protein LOC62_01G000157 [Vanrija pseudolonga]|uniref:Uncharacterized protein n=1 Tax=Vanrija pseudolonga TaxID=143232 RepID=A0AAF1BGN7_9TREE|nr:hypothetical protein LOC62_01G000157 [Vanrija pseudolonga]